jgi:hypothetical protein
MVCHVSKVLRRGLPFPEPPGLEPVQPAPGYQKNQKLTEPVLAWPEGTR